MLNPLVFDWLDTMERLTSAHKHQHAVGQKRGTAW